MKSIFLISYILLSFTFSLNAQHIKKYVEGIVEVKSQNGKKIPLIGANIFWIGTTIGTISDTAGRFKIDKISEIDSILVISFMGYKNDTINVNGKDFLSINLKEFIELEEIEILHRKKTTEISFVNPLKVENISHKELLKAACCNLSESFETNPSVDVNYTDAIIGTKQIQMLGLSSPYIQITRENIPDVRGLSTIYGITFTPGHWIESIQLNKGTGSVTNGFESIIGQINVELQKPESANRLYLNAYGNADGRLEGNINLAHRFNKNLSAILLLHEKNNSVKRDRNDDGFLDNLLGNQFIALNKWQFRAENGIAFQFGIKGLFFDNIGGQKNFDPNNDKMTTNNWGLHLKIKRIDAWMKIGTVFEDFPWKTLGLQISGNKHTQDSYFGLNKYDAKQSSLYGNFIYQSILHNTNHKFRVGASFQLDDFKENLNNTDFDRKELIPGIHFEYTYNKDDKLNIVAGARADYHNHYKLFNTFRFHLRYAIAENTIFRFSGGNGQRTANVLSENNSLFASSREIQILGDESNKPYGLKAETAWNFGINLTKKFSLKSRDALISLDLYRTDFKNQIVLDLDQHPQKALFYNLRGKSFSNSMQIQLDYEVIPNMDVRIAYRLFDVKTTYNKMLLQKPLISKHRAFLNFAYKTDKNWKFDFTINWQGQKRIPYTASNPIEYQLPENSPDFLLTNTQINKFWNEKFETYFGIENIFDYKQKNAILANNIPFSPYFDSSLIWGPIHGRKIYFGIRYKIK